MAGGGVRGHCGRSLLTDSSEQKRVCSVFGLRCPLTSELDHFGNQAVFFFFFCGLGTAPWRSVPEREGRSSGRNPVSPRSHPDRGTEHKRRLCDDFEGLSS